MDVHKVEEQEGQAEEKNKGKEDLKVSLLTQVLPWIQMTSQLQINMFWKY